MVRTAVRWIVVALIFGFIGRSLAANWDQLREAELDFNPVILLASIALLGLWMFIQASIWHLLTVYVGTPIRYSRALAAWFYSQLGKYLPGKVFLYLGRLHFYSKEGKSAGPVGLASGVEIVGTIAASIFVVLLSAFTVDLEGVESYRGLLIAALALLMVVLHPRLLSGVIKAVARLVRRPPFAVTLGYGEILRVLVLYVLNWIVFGMALFLLIRSFYAVQPSSILLLAGGFSLAAMVGIVAVFAPSGLGVREALLAVFLGQVMPTGVALLSSVLSRVWLTVVELAAVSVVFLMIRFDVIDADGVGGWRSLRRSAASEELRGGFESQG